MAGRQAIGAKLARQSQQVGELHALIAAHARDRRPPLRVIVRETLDHAFAEPTLIVEHIMSDAEPLGDLGGIVDILPRAAAAGARHRRTVIVELERHPDHFGAAPRGERGHHRAVDAAGHRDDDARALCGPGQLPIDLHAPEHRGSAASRTASRKVANGAFTLS
jgi:hypothetical protein